MAEKKSAAQAVTDELIRQIAFRLWEEEGHPHGRDQDHWHRATEIAAAKKVIAAKKAAAKVEADKKPAAKKAAAKKAA